jgi:hypothetical protein
MSVRVAALVAAASLAVLTPSAAHAADAFAGGGPAIGGLAADAAGPVLAADLAPVKAVPDSTVTFDGTVETIAYAGDRIYVGGSFTHAIGRDGTRVVRTRLAALDAKSGNLLTWNPRADGRVRTLTVSDRGVFVGGDFGTVNGAARDSLAQLDPNTGGLTAFKHSVSGHVHALAAVGDRLYAGGTITTVDGVAVKRLAAFNLTTGKLDAGWLPKASGTVHAILPTTAGIFLGGGFGSINSASGTAHIASVDGAGAVLPFRTKAPYTVFSLTVSNNTLYAGVDGPGGRAMAVDAVSGAVKWEVTTDGDVRAVVRVRDLIYIGGHYDRVCKSSRTGDKGACLDGSAVRIKLCAVDPAGNLQPWTADGNGSVGVLALAASAGLGKVAAGGQFTKINGATQNRFAQFPAS